MIIPNQNYPRQLTPNCLLTRYPLLFIHGVKNFINFYNYWHGIPVFLKNHGYEVFEAKTKWRGAQLQRIALLKMQLDQVLTLSPRVHIVAHSLGTLDSLFLSSEYGNKIESLTLISPPLGGTPWADWGKGIFKWLNDALTEDAARKIVESFVKNDIFVTSIISDPQFSVSPYLKSQHITLSRYLKLKNKDPRNDGLVPFESQKRATLISDRIITFPGDHLQVIGAAPWPKGHKTAHEVLLDHCIFLAERDLQKAK